MPRQPGRTRTTSVLFCRSIKLRRKSLRRLLSMRKRVPNRPFLMLCVAVMTAATGLPPNLQAQAEPVDAALWGRVFLADDTVGIPGVVVELLGARVRTTTGPRGFYRFWGLEPGAHTLRVRRVGYQSLTLDVVLLADRAEQRDIRLTRLATTLTRIRIEGEVREVPPRFEEVYRRMTTANGKFFTREDIDRLNPQDVQSLLLRVPTARINSQGIQFARCNEAGALALSPGGGKVHIYIDGFRMTGRGSLIGEKDPVEAEQREVLRSVKPTQIQAIEVYSGVSRIPGEFLEDACAVIAIWTRSY